MRETEWRAMEAAIDIDAFRREALGDLIALSLRAWEPVFRSIEQAMDADVFRHFYPDWRVEQASAVEKTCTAEGARVWTASIGLTVVGFVAVKVHDDSGMGEVYMIAVDPHHQRKGIARALMGRAMAYMKEAGLSIAMVETGGDPGHAPARSAYERMGFKQFPAARYFKKL